MEQAISRRIPVNQVSLTAEGYLLAGEMDRATRLTVRSLDFSRHRKQRSNEAWALRLLGEIAAYHDHPDVATAEANYAAAIAQASEIGMRPLIAHCHLGLGKMHRR